MSGAKRAAVAVVLAAACIAATAESEPIRWGTPLQCTRNGVDLTLDPGVYLPDADWDALDLEVTRLQDVETRLTAENESFRKEADSYRPGWRTLAVMLAIGFAGGYYVANR